MDLLDRTTIQEAAADLAEEIKTRSATGAAAKLAHFGGAEIAAALLRLSPGFAQDVLGALPDDARERTLGAAPAAVARQWQRNALYDEDAVGRMMEPVVGAFPPDASVGEAVDALREAVRTGGALITYLWVVDAEDRLLGIVTMRDLLFSDRARTLGEVMLKHPFTLHAATPLKEAMKQVLDRHYPVYPVVDADRRLIGLVRGQAMFEAQAIEITLQAGSMVGVDEEERLATPLWQSFRMRHPWLQLNLFTAFGTAAVVHYFDATIEQVVVLAAFLPVLSCLAGNSGCQALAITLRGLTMGEIDRVPRRALISKEVKVGALNGLFTGLVAAIAMYAFAVSGGEDSPFLLALMMPIAMVAACAGSCLLGTIVPLAVHRAGADPATASGLFVLTITDIFGMGFMLMLATLVLL